ncbi:hypothetical protein COR50_10290 [Chitinophaga caeni]|uniref:Uncharacterized protein n=1 Tax=Chitinophaga caeni TaxID=2029983 RepID=A0A291QUJ6_9BACT|nr:hypothetical protein [Chitinophaga caeni]ATL47524.1 hypothetical protein COR50_10290 [Chitinophaga caeni]
MLFFDFLYYLSYKLYSSYNEKGAESTSVSVVGGLQTLNVTTVIMLITWWSDRKAHFNILLGVALFVVFEVYNYRRFLYQKKHSVDVIENKWINKTEASRNQVKAIVVLYIVISIVSFFGLAIYIGSKNNV